MNFHNIKCFKKLIALTNTTDVNCFREIIQLNIKQYCEVKFHFTMIGAGDVIVCNN